MLNGKKILVTAGPTYEYLDEIRFITNKSSGKQGTEIAKCLQKLEADVTLVVGPVNLDLSSLRKVIRVETALQMHDTVMRKGPFDIAICTAAVGDWRPREKAKNKIKKTCKGNPLKLDLIENPDILKDISSSGNRPNLVIGFAAETNNLLTNARLKLNNKGCDWIIANQVGSQNHNMGGEENEVVIVKRNEEIELTRRSKKNIAEVICKEIIEEISAI